MIYKIIFYIILLIPNFVFAITQEEKRLIVAKFATKQEEIKPITLDDFIAGIKSHRVELCAFAKIVCGLTCAVVAELYALKSIAKCSQNRCSLEKMELQVLIGGTAMFYGFNTFIQGINELNTLFEINKQKKEAHQAPPQ